METTKEVELKLWTFIIRPQGIQVNIPEQISFSLAFDEAEAMKNVINLHKNLPINIKSTGYFTLKQIKDTLGKLFEPIITTQPISAETPASEIKVVSVGEQVVNLLTYLLNDENAKAEREKLIATDLKNIKRIIKKL